MSLDLKDIARAETARIEILHPVTRAATGCFVTVYGPGSDVFEAASERLRARRLALVRRYKRAEDIPNDASATAFREFLAEVTSGIEGLESGGVPVEFSRKAAMEFYSDADIAVQVSQEMGDRANFSRG